MAWGLLEDEDRLRLDPAVAEFVRQRTATQGLPAPETVPPPIASPSPQDAAAMADLERMAAKDERTQGLGYLGGLLSDAGALMRGKDRPFRAPPQVDDSIRKFIISRKMASPQKPGEYDHLPPTPQDIEGAINAGVPEKVARNAPNRGVLFKLYGQYGEPQDPQKVKPTLEQHAEYVRRGAALKRPVLPTAGEPPKDFAKRVESQEQEEAAGPMRVSDDARKDTIELRREFNKLPAVQDMETAATSYKKVKTTSDSGAGDISLIFAYMKMLDPGSTVREGEFATAANAGSIPQSVMAAYNKAVNGEKLAAPVRKMFKDESKKVYAATRDRYKLKAAEYKRIAKDLGLNPSHVVTEMDLEEDTPARPGDEFLK